jgi:2-hydroxychromene-2-carboxylate isomerase
MSRPVLYFDLASPYGYLAVERAADVLGEEPELQPVLLGAIFRRRGWGSWAETSSRKRNVAEVERRAEAYGLPIVWPPGWPPNSLAAQRAAIHARGEGRLRPFALAAYRAAFRDGQDLSRVEVLQRAGEAAGLDPLGLAEAVVQPRVKEALKQATEEALAAGVMGVPTIRVGGQVFWGDERLETAAMVAALRRQRQSAPDRGDPGPLGP